MKRILDRLMICDLSEANDPTFLGIYKVQAILHFGQGGMFPDDIKLYHRDVRGALSDADLRDGVDFLRESMRNGRRVLAVGASGATIVGTYLTEMGFSAAQASQMVHGADVHAMSAHEETLQRRSGVTLYDGSAGKWE